MFFMFLFLLFNLISKCYIQNLIAICEIHQFHLHFSVHPSLTGDLSLVRYVWGAFHTLMGRTSVFGLCTKKL